MSAKLLSEGFKGGTLVRIYRRAFCYVERLPGLEAREARELQNPNKSIKIWKLKIQAEEKLFHEYFAFKMTNLYNNYPAYLKKKGGYYFGWKYRNREWGVSCMPSPLTYFMKCKKFRGFKNLYVNLRELLLTKNLYYYWEAQCPLMKFSKQTFLVPMDRKSYRIWIPM